MKNFFVNLFLGCTILTLAACGPQPTPTPVAAAPTATNPAPQPDSTKTGRAIVVGDISDDPAEVIEGTQPVADYLAGKLAAHGITSGQVRIAASIDEMVELLKKGEVDLYFDSTYPATFISDASGGQIILRRWKFGVEKYNSVIFASKASGITSIDQLPGHIIAMDAPYSTSGFLLPAVYLKEKGLTLTGKKDYSAKVDANEVGFAFSYDDENTLQWVLGGYTSVGATDDYQFDTGFPRDAVEKLVELARTESTPRQVAVSGPQVEPALVDAIKLALIGMDAEGNEAGKAALKTYATAKFDDFPEGLDVATARMREMMKIVKEISLP